MHSTHLQTLLARAATIAGISHSRFFSTCRQHRVCRARYAAWHVLYHNGLATLSSIASASGRGCHATILHGIRRAAQLIQRDPSFAALVSNLQSSISQ